MAIVNIDVAKQVTSDEINSKIGFSDMELIEIGKNYTAVQFNNLAATETELLSITGEGAMNHLKIGTTTANEVFIKIYLDGKILFDFSVLHASSSTSVEFTFGVTFPYGGNSSFKLQDLHKFVGNFQILATTTLTGLYSPILPTFKNSLKIYGYATTNDLNNYIQVSYGLKG